MQKLLGIAVLGLGWLAGREVIMRVVVSRERQEKGTGNLAESLRFVQVMQEANVGSLVL